MDVTDIIDPLNEPQREAVTSAEKPTLVLAGAGSGKTRVLVHRIAWAIRVSGLFTGPRRETDMAEELESHVQLHIDDNLRAGMTPEEARRQALIRLGGVEATNTAAHKPAPGENQRLPHWNVTTIPRIRNGSVPRRASVRLRQ